MLISFQLIQILILIQMSKIIVTQGLVYFKVSHLHVTLFDDDPYFVRNLMINKTIINIKVTAIAHSRNN